MKMNKYNLNWLLDSIERGEVQEYIYFWGHTPNKDNAITAICFSQWFPSIFEVENIVYLSAEHWMMAQKAKLFGDEEYFEKIIKSKNPSEAKKLGREVRNFQIDIWNEKCFEIVVQGNMHKFSQNHNLKDFLLSTENKIIVEASPYDKIWGIGLEAIHTKAKNPATWNGLNLLGFALMETRDRLRM
ncbi:MAG: NADAR family protein [Cytophagia bacterium]|nr:MAG: NADAR family protein [Cytophagales bacterium]TAF98949.1 MAG: NADAR family protein [Cytophagia bacterium]TAG45862.1 MAG: NADAR family protein [Cytophagia bacterium]TAH31329.1 MAG: NADAR family protein [Cytophagales bacterium]